MSNIKAARNLGWASIATGATELVAARWLQRQIGVRGHNTLVRAFGVREIAVGTAILSHVGVSQSLSAALWSRVLGDVVDITTLAATALYTRRPSGLSAITALVLAVTGLDFVIGARVQQEVAEAKRASENARKRVQPTKAMPLGAVAVEPVASRAAW